MKIFHLINGQLKGMYLKMSHDRGCYCGKEPYEYSDCTKKDCSRKQTKKVISVFDFEPDLGASTPEPSLKTIVFKYYNRYFDDYRSLQYTNQYFEQIEKIL